MMYLIAYDIADPKRLSRVARRLEKVAQRCQKSVFCFQGNSTEIEALLDELSKLLDLRMDLIQAWKLAIDQTARGSARGCFATVAPEGIIWLNGQSFFVTKTDRASGYDHDSSR